MLPPLQHLARIARTVSDWPVASQQRSRRNAMVALTACTRRREEREEVASYLAARTAARPAPSGAAAGPSAAAHA